MLYFWWCHLYWEDFWCLLICILQSVVCSLQSAVCGLWSAVCGLQSAVCSLQLQMSYTATKAVKNFSQDLRWKVCSKVNQQAFQIICHHIYSCSIGLFFIIAEIMKHWWVCRRYTPRKTYASFNLAQLFEGRLMLNPGLNLARVSFSCVQKHFLG